MHIHARWEERKGGGGRTEEPENNLKAGASGLHYVWCPTDTETRENTHMKTCIHTEYKLITNMSREEEDEDEEICSRTAMDTYALAHPPF